MRVFLVIALFAACTLAQEESAPTCRPPEEKFEAEEFSCEQQTEFPLEEYEKVLSGAEKDEKIQHVKELLDSYEQVEAKSAMCPTAQETPVDAAIARRTRWVGLCPTWSYWIYRWGIYIRPYGRCYVLTPVKVTRCVTRNCRYVSPWYYYRCLHDYRTVNILAFCPSAPFPFVWTRRTVSRGCSCHRLICGFTTLSADSSFSRA